MTAPGSQPKRIEDTLFASARRVPTKDAIIDGDRSLDYATLAGAVRALAADLVARGITPGDHVAIFLDKTLDAPIAMYGVWAAGAVTVPINEGLRSAQVRHILDDSGSKLLIASQRRLDGVDAESYAGVPTLVADLTTLVADRTTLVADRTTLVADRTALVADRTALAPSDGAPPAGSAGDAPAAELPGGTEPAAILYTSGSTGRPKGILIAHANLLAGTRIVTRYLEITERERILSVLPFSFDYGLNQMLTAVAAGATLVLQRSLFPADVCRALERFEITGLAGVPTFWIQLMQRHSPFPRQQFPKLRYITNSGGVFPMDLIKRYREQLTNTRIFPMYGLSEAFRSTYLPPEEIDRRPGSMGKAIPECEILVVDEHGKICGPDQVGELVHAGPTVSLGYWKRPDSTAAVFRPDPRDPNAPLVVYSGDLVRKDADGFLYFVGRRDQQIKSHGFRMSPEEVEEAVNRSGMVAEVIVRGIPDELAGQVVVAHVVARNPEAFSVADLKSFCEAEMPRYMVPKHIEVHEKFPRTSSGKVDRANVGR
jgi:acyl-CoA ligase (AMP-forming) (exosortase A-associated)